MQASLSNTRKIVAATKKSLQSACEEEAKADELRGCLPLAQPTHCHHLGFTTRQGGRGTRVGQGRKRKNENVTGVS